MIKTKRPRKQKEPPRPPAPRNGAFEQALCDAIARHRIVRLSYDHEGYSRTFQPYIVYHSEQDHYLVGGTQTVDDSKPGKPPVPHKFEIGRISTLSVTKSIFEYDTRFNPFRDEYVGRTICVIHRVKIPE
jgi:WYL domain-containing protein